MGCIQFILLYTVLWGLYRGSATEMETTIQGLGFTAGMVYMCNGEENGNYYSILCLYGDSGKENENYYIIGLYKDYIEVCMGLIWGFL